MSADLSIDFDDGREQISIPVAPQSWLRDHWRPEAKIRSWGWVDLLCGNNLQITERADAVQLLVELDELRSFVSALDNIAPSLQAGMLDRFDEWVPSVIKAVADWEGVRILQIG